MRVSDTVRQPFWAGTLTVFILVPMNSSRHAFRAMLSSGGADKDMDRRRRVKKTAKASLESLAGLARE